MTADSEARVAQAVASKLDSGTQWLLRREIATLPRVLPAGEEIVQLAQGRHDGATGLILVTDRRLMFVEQGVAHQRVEDLPYDSISSVQAEVSVVESELTISGVDRQVMINQVYPKSETVKIAGYVRKRTSGPGDAGHSLGHRPQAE